MTHHHPDPDAAHGAVTADCMFSQENLEAFALGALGGNERSRMEQHLAWCGPCRRGLAEIRRITTLLPFLSPPAVPSAAAKAALFKRIAENTTEHAENRMIPGNPWIPREPRARPKPAGGNKTPPAPWQRWVAPGLIAPLAICLIVLSAWTNSLRNEVNMLRSAEASRMTSAVTAPAQPDMQLYSFRPACEKCKEKQASGQLGGNPDGSTGIVVAWDLDPNEKHQVWCVDTQGQKRLVSDLHVAQTGNVVQTVNFPHPIGGYEQIYVARQDGTEGASAELLVAVNEEHEVNIPGAVFETPLDH